MAGAVTDVSREMHQKCGRRVKVRGTLEVQGPGDPVLEQMLVDGRPVGDAQAAAAAEAEAAATAHRLATAAAAATPYDPRRHGSLGACTVCLEALEGEAPPLQGAQGPEAAPPPADPAGIILFPPCSHAFHAPCLLAWLQHKATCPVCRAQWPAAEGETEQGDEGGGQGAGAPQWAPVPGEEQAQPPS